MSRSNGRSWSSWAGDVSRRSASTARAGHLIAEVLSLDGQRTERIEADIRTIEEAREQGRQLRVKAQDLIDEAYKKLGIHA